MVKGIYGFGLLSRVLEYVARLLCFRVINDQIMNSTRVKIFFMLNIITGALRIRSFRHGRGRCIEVTCTSLSTIYRRICVFFCASDDSNREASIYNHKYSAWI